MPGQAALMAADRLSELAWVWASGLASHAQPGSYHGFRDSEDTYHAKIKV